MEQELISDLNYNDFNNFEEHELADLGGIGKAIAKRIVSNRPFRSNDDLFKIKGLGARTLKKYGIVKSKKERKKWITVDGVEYPHYAIAIDERTGVADLFWRVPREYRIYYGREAESKIIAENYRKKINADLR